MKALSVKHLYACAILLGLKTLEVRDRRPSALGPYCVCSTKRQNGVSFDRRNDETFRILEQMIALPSGHALCVVTVTGWREMLPGDEAEALVPFQPGKIVWTLANPRAIVPFHQRGNVTDFQVDDSLIVFPNPQPPSTNPQSPRTIEDRLSRPTVGVPPLPDLCESRSSFALQGLHS